MCHVAADYVYTYFSRFLAISLKSNSMSTTVCLLPAAVSARIWYVCTAAVHTGIPGIWYLVQQSVSYQYRLRTNTGPLIRNRDIGRGSYVDFLF